MNRKLLLYLLLLILGTNTLYAQKSITGKITDEDGAPILGATVQIINTTIGTISGLDGVYHLTIPQDVKSDTLVFSFIGKTTVYEPINGRTNISPILKDDNVEVEEVVVTALGISRREKTLGYAATKVDAEDIVNAKTSNVADAIAGKVAGVQVSATSSNPGALSNMVIRGYSSIKGNNQPLYVVDGIPVTNRSVTSGDITLSTGGISNISANDIESLTILKGAAATALYGSRASNGVVVITTKSGKKAADKNFTIEYNGSVMARRVSYLADMQNEFGQGWNGRQTYIENGSWGPRFDGTTQAYGPIYNGQQLTHKYEALENNVKDFFDTGWSQAHSLSINGASEDNKLTYYLSYAITNDNNIIPGDKDKYNRNTIAYRTTYKATDWLKLSSAINFARTKTNGVGTGQGITVIDGLYELPREVSIVDLKDLDNVFNTPTAYFTPYGITNPYWALENTELKITAKEIIGKVQADITPIRQLTFTYRFSFDYADNDAKVGIPKIDVDESLMWDNKGYSPTTLNQAGSITSQYSKKYELNHDILAIWNDKYFNDKIDISATAGLNINERTADSFTGIVSDLSINTGFWDISNGAAKDDLVESNSKRRLIGLLGDVTIGYNDLVYLEYSLRNDWSSTLPINANSYFYQGITASFLFSNLIPENNILSFGKVRLAYGTTGNDTNPYNTSDSFLQAYANAVYASEVAKFPINGINAFQKGSYAGNPELKPEMTHELEAGINLQFLNGRVGVDFALYKRNTEDQIFALPVDPATGYGYMYVNYGEVENKGFEIVLNTQPLKIKDFTWDLDINFTKNYNKVVSLPKELEGGKTVINSFGKAADGLYMYAEEGKPFGVFYANVPERDKQGNIIVDSYGIPILSKDPEYTGKDIQPDFTAGASTTFSWKGISLSAAIDIVKGGYMFSRTKNLMQFTGNGIGTLYNSRNPFIIPNSVVKVDTDDGPVYVENTTPVSLTDGNIQGYFDNGNVVGGEDYLIERSYLKLRNITLSYTFPKALVRKIKLSDVSLGVFCNNVYFWTHKSNRFIDPENTSYARDGDLAAQFGELYSNPSCRIWGLNLNLKF